MSSSSYTPPAHQNIRHIPIPISSSSSTRLVPRVLTFRVPESSFSTTVPSSSTIKTIPISYANESSSAETEDNNVQIHETTIKIPHSLIGKFIGKNGSNKRSFESEYNIQAIIPPRQNNNDDVMITLQATNEKDLITAERYLNKWMGGVLRRLPPSHFLSLPLPTLSSGAMDTVFMSKIDAFHKDILGMNARGMDASILVPASRLHLTLGVMKLYTKEDVQKACLLLKECSREIYDVLGTRTAVVRLKGLEIMKGSVKDAHVVYAKIEDSGESYIRLKGLVKVLVKRFVQSGFIDERDAEKAAESVLLHVTLINSKYRKGNRGRAGSGSNDGMIIKDSEEEDNASVKSFNSSGSNSRRRSRQQAFDATQIFQKYGDMDFGTMRLGAVQLAMMLSSGSDGDKQKRAVNEYRFETQITLP